MDPITKEEYLLARDLVANGRHLYSCCALEDAIKHVRKVPPSGELTALVCDVWLHGLLIPALLVEGVRITDNDYPFMNCGYTGEARRARRIELLTLAAEKAP